MILAIAKESFQWEEARLQCVAGGA